jgi:carboxymethylenebutenolidase
MGKGMCIDCGNESVDRRSFLAGVASASAGVAFGCQGERPKPEASEARASDSKPTEQKLSEARALDDPTTQEEMVSFRSGEDTVQGYLARPKVAGQYRAVVVLHGNFGVPEAQRNTAAQLAQNGFVGLAYKRFCRWPELTQQDLIKSDQTDKRFLSWSFSKQELQDAQAAIDHLKSQPFVKPGGVGMIGFCGGGYQALLLSMQSKDIKAVVVFYAPPEAGEQFQNPKDPKPSLMDKVEQIKVPVQGHYGTDDPFVPLEPVKKFEQALKAKGTPVTVFTYEGATHGFCDYASRRYHAEAAARATSRMLDFLKEQLK